MKTPNCRTRTVVFLLLGVLASSTARAQDPAPEPVRTAVERRELSAARLAELRAQLASSDPAQTAWAAWESVQHHATQLVDDLKVTLRRTLAEADSPTKPFVLRAELDALVQLDAHFDALEFAAARRAGAPRTQTLVIAARDPQRHAREIERMRESSRHEERVAVDNLLAVGAPDRAVALLLPDARLELTIDVCDPDTFAGLGGSRGSSIGCGGMTAPEGFPPTVLYECVRSLRKDDVVFADGPQPVAYRRIVRSELTFGVGHHAQKFDEAEHALRLLRWIAEDRSGESLLTSTSHVRHVWTNAANYLAEVRAELERRETAWRALLERLAQVNALPREQFPSTSHVDLRVADHREDRSVELPEIR